jgi:uncharacterized iron-regulated membrane protein
MTTDHLSPWQLVRKVILKIHLYAGLISGLVVIVVCLSGTIYVYNTEIRELANPELYKVEVGSERLSPDEIREKLEAQEQSNVVGLTWREEEESSVEFTLKKEGEEGRGTTYFVNPYTSEILGNTSEETATAEFMGYMVSLHRWLLLDRIEEPILESKSNRDLGRFINGISTVLFTLGVLTGIIVWFPNKIKNWKRGLKVKWDANWKRVNHDLHYTLAFYSLIFLFIMGATGLFWSFEGYREGWQKTWDTYQDPNAPKEVKTEILPITDRPSLISINGLIQKTDQELPYAGIIRISLPEKTSDPVSVRKYKSGFFARAGSDELTLNPNSLEVIQAKLFSDLPFPQQIGRSVKSLHTGDIFGQFTKFLWFVACLIATSLPITGTLIWWNRRQKKRKMKTQKVRTTQLA